MVQLQITTNNDEAAITQNSVSKHFSFRQARCICRSFNSSFLIVMVGVLYRETYKLWKFSVRALHKSERQFSRSYKIITYFMSW